MAYRMTSIVALACGLAIALAGSLQADEWGTLKGRLVYDGPPPVPAKLSVTKDVEVCSKHHPVDESLLVDKEGGLANVVIYIRVPRGTKLPVHPDYEKETAAEVTMDNLHCRFDPHVAMIRTSQTLALKNSDSVGHNTKADCFVNASFNDLIPAGGTVEKKLSEEERLPVQVGCNIHPWMTGYVLVRDNPYMAVTGEDGTFEIKNVPAGEHEFQMWHEKSGYLADVVVKGTPAKRGRFEIEVGGEEIDLGEIAVPESTFAAE